MCNWLGTYRKHLNGAMQVSHAVNRVFSFFFLYQTLKSNSTHHTLVFRRAWMYIMDLVKRVSRICVESRLGQGEPGLWRLTPTRLTPQLACIWPRGAHQSSKGHWHVAAFGRWKWEMLSNNERKRGLCIEINPRTTVDNHINFGNNKKGMETEAVYYLDLTKILFIYVALSVK